MFSDTFSNELRAALEFAAKNSDSCGLSFRETNNTGSIGWITKPL